MKWIFSLTLLLFCAACSFGGQVTSVPSGEIQSNQTVVTETPVSVYLPNVGKDDNTTLEVVEISVTPNISMIETKVAAGIAATLDAMPAPTQVDTPIPIVYPAPMVSHPGVGGNYTLDSESTIAGYTIRLWKDY